MIITDGMNNVPLNATEKSSVTATLLAAGITDVNKHEDLYKRGEGLPEALARLASALTGVDMMYVWMGAESEDLKRHMESQRHIQYVPIPKGQALTPEACNRIVKGFVERKPGSRGNAKALVFNAVSDCQPVKHLVDTMIQRTKTLIPLPNAPEAITVHDLIGMMKEAKDKETGRNIMEVNGVTDNGRFEDIIHAISVRSKTYCEEMRSKKENGMTINVLIPGLITGRGMEKNSMVGKVTSSEKRAINQAISKCMRSLPRSDPAKHLKYGTYAAKEGCVYVF